MKNYGNHLTQEEEKKIEDKEGELLDGKTEKKKRKISRTEKRKKK